MSDAHPNPLLFPTDVHTHIHSVHGSGERDDLLGHPPIAGDLILLQEWYGTRFDITRREHRWIL